MTSIAAFVKKRRKEARITQEQLAEKSGVALTVIRKIEQGKTNLTITSVNLILQMFGHELAPINSKDVMK